MSFQSKVNSLIARAAQGNPEMLDFMQEIINELLRLGLIVDPPPSSLNRLSGDIFTIPNLPRQFTYEITSKNVILEWGAVTSPAEFVGQQPNTEIVYYELRKATTDPGDWDTSTKVLVTGERKVILDPHLVGGHQYFLKTISLDGKYSVGTLGLRFVIPPLGGVSISPTVIDQNVLLYWTAATSTFDIDHYNLKRNGVDLFTVKGTFAPQVELLKGVYTYTITPVDIAGNIGPDSTISVNVTGPPDFVLKNEFSSTLTGTKVNALVDNGLLILPVDLTKTWQTHFTSRGWNSPQDQITAGYPYFLQPTTTTASYKEIFDVGAIYPATIISITWNITVLTGAFTVGVSTRVSNDGVIWSAPQTGQNVFVNAVRYIEVTVSFTGANDAAILLFYNFHVAVAVKQAMDSGEVSALASDVNGTFVTFHVAFRDVDSITVSPKTTTEQFTAVFRFNDIPDPTGFSVFVYDSSGIRVSKPCEWKARGIV